LNSLFRRENNVLLVLFGLVAVLLVGTRSNDGSAAAVGRASTKSPCTWYVSPKGSVRSGGRSGSRATTLRNAYKRAVAGDVVCLLGGRYRLRQPLSIVRGGKPGAWIVYRSYEGRAVITAAAPLRAALIQVQAPAAYLPFNGLSFDGGRLNALEAVILGRRVHHVRFTGNLITNMSAAGLATVGADYVNFIGNKIYRFGDGVGWSSGISFNSGAGAFWYDRASGFHTIIANNIVAGGVDSSSHHSDGNGIIIDNGRDIAPILIANNLVYENGGRCIENLTVSHVWVVNNTCYSDGLDDRVGMVGEIQNYNVEDVHIINNVAVAWTQRYPYRTEGAAEVTFSHDYAYGGLPSIVPADVRLDSSALRMSSPRFIDPIRVQPAGDRQWETALSVMNVGTRFRPASGSVLKTGGTDPRTEPGVTAEYRAAFDRFLSHDIVGRPRWIDGRYSVGAYDS
jgi:hypothetical protein